eukprot:767107-Hanusia_phi.AAC.4
MSEVESEGRTSAGKDAPTSARDLEAADAAWHLVGVQRELVTSSQHGTVVLLHQSCTEPSDD